MNINKSKLYDILLISFTIILLFSFIFNLYDYSHFNGIDKNDKNRFFNRVYFTITTLSSAGYGDITPKSNQVKLISVILQFILIIGLMGGIATIFKPLNI